MELTLTQLSVKNSYTEFYKNPTKGLVADTRHTETDGRTGERRWSPYKKLLFFFFANVTNKREDIELQQAIANVTHKREDVQLQQAIANVTHKREDIQLHQAIANVTHKREDIQLL